MERIKSVLHGHKKSQDATHDSHAAPATGTHTAPATDTHIAGHEHPIYDEMTGQKNDHGTAAPSATSGTTASAGQTGESSGVGAAHSASGPHPVADTTRPAANYPNEGLSEASIKSGVIGFGRDGQEHAAMPKRSNTVQDKLSTDQVLGGGNAVSSPNQRTVGQPGMPSHPDNHSDFTSRDQTSTTAQPFEDRLRKESFITDSDRSFPLAGGVVSKHGADHSSATNHPPTTTATSATSNTTHHPITSEREPGTKEKEAGVRDGHGREGLATAAGAAAIAAPLAYAAQKDVQSQGAETRQATYGNNSASVPTTTSSNTTSNAQNVHPEALAAARAAAGKSSSPTSGFGNQTTPRTTGLMGGLRPLTQRSESHPHIPGEFPTPTPDESKTFLYYRDDLVPEPGSNVPLTAGHHGAHDQTVAPVVAGASSTTAGPHRSDVLNKADPRADSDHDGSATLGGTTATATTGQHELRHTGTLDEPRPRSAGHSDDHTGRNAALAGGLGAGAAGLAYAATRKNDGPTVGGDVPSPYSSTAIDPRVLGQQSTLDEQRFDPSVKIAEPATHHALETSSSAGTTPVAGGTSHSTAIAQGTDASTASIPAKKDESEHHYGRDAALIGAGAATGAGVRHALQRNDTPGTGTSVLPQDSAATSAPKSSAAPIPSAAPLPSSEPTPSIEPTSTTSSTSTQPTAATRTYVSSYKGPLTTSGTPFYGTASAPAPREAIKSTPTHQPTSTSSTATAGPTAQDKETQHHYNRDAALVGGAAAAAGGLAYASQRDDKPDTGPASKTIGPHSSNVANVLDPRVQPDPSKQVHHNAGAAATDPASRTIGPHESNIANILDPRVQPDPSKQKATAPYQSEKVEQKDHHYIRDATLAGGAGAAGYGAYEAAKAYGEHRSTQSGASMDEQRYDPTAPGAKAPSPVPAAGVYNYNDDATMRNVNQTGTSFHDTNKDNTSRNLALGGAALGAGALGGAAYAGSKHGDHTTAAATQPAGPTTGLTGHQAPTDQSQPTQPTTSQPVTGASHNRYDSMQQPSDKDSDHTKRNAALAGTAGAAAIGGGAYAYSQHQDADREMARVEEEQRQRKKEMEKEQHRLDKEHKKEGKKLEKEHRKEEQKHDKAVAAAAAKEEKKHAKEEEKEEKRLEKEREKEEKRLEKEEKGGFLGFLHRDKSKREKRNSSDSSHRDSADAGRKSLESNPRYSRELGVSGDEAHHSDSNSPRWKGKKLLHKEPPKGHPARESLERRDDVELKGMKGEHVGTDGEIGRHDAISGHTETRSGVYGAQPINEIPENNKVIEPHTGLPMNVGRYGDGAGGTDANPAIMGHHAVSGYDENLSAGRGTTNWEAIRKGDTTY